MKQMTITEFVDHLGGKFAQNFRRFDMNINYKIASNKEDWYGIELVNTRFDFGKSYVVSDRFGGGCTEVVSIEMGMDSKTISKIILTLIIKTLSHEEHKICGDTIIDVDM